jgi:hypothetical protein
MSKSKRRSAYPEVYFSIFEEVSRAGEYHSSPCPNPKLLEAMRFDIYGWKGALHAEDHPNARVYESYKCRIVETEEGWVLAISDDSAVVANLFGLPSPTFEVPTNLELDDDEITAGEETLQSLGFTTKKEDDE